MSAKYPLVGIDNSNGFFPQDAELPGWGEREHQKAHEKKGMGARGWAMLAATGALALGVIVIAGGDDTSSAPETPPASTPSETQGSIVPVIDISQDSLPASDGEGIAPVGSTLAPILRNTVVVTAAP